SGAGRRNRARLYRPPPPSSDAAPAPWSRGSYGELVDLGVADDLDHRRRSLQRRGQFAPYFHVRRPPMRIEVVAGFPALDHHIGVGVVDTGMALVRHAALLLARLGDAGLVAVDEGIASLGLHLRGGDNVDHGNSLPGFLLFLPFRT